MTNEKILHLTLKKVWFDKIKSGEKKEEYREIKHYWIKRLYVLYMVRPKDFDYVVFRNGYSKNAPTVKVEFKGIDRAYNIETPIGKGDYFVIKLGDVVDE
jgi:hypothetical protein